MRIDKTGRLLPPRRLPMHAVVILAFALGCIVGVAARGPVTTEAANLRALRAENQTLRCEEARQHAEAERQLAVMVAGGAVAAAQDVMDRVVELVGGTREQAQAIRRVSQ